MIQPWHKVTCYWFIFSLAITTMSAYAQDSASIDMVIHFPEDYVGKTITFHNVLVHGLSHGTLAIFEPMPRKTLSLGVRHGTKPYPMRIDVPEIVVLPEIGRVLMPLVTDGTWAHLTVTVFPSETLWSQNWVWYVECIQILKEKGEKREAILSPKHPLRDQLTQGILVWQQRNDTTKWIHDSLSSQKSNMQADQNVRELEWKRIVDKISEEIFMLQEGSESIKEHAHSILIYKKPTEPDEITNKINALELLEENVDAFKKSLLSHRDTLLKKAKDMKASPPEKLLANIVELMVTMNSLEYKITQGISDARTLNSPAVEKEDSRQTASLQSNQTTVSTNKYLAIVEEKIDSLWVAPAVTMSKLPLKIIVKFRILRSGEIADLQLKEKSGNLAYDAAAKRAVQNASPLPPFPIDLHDSYLDILYKFQITDYVE